jgi:arabinan endo-1,5-alpha-L-arabinosidase
MNKILLTPIIVLLFSISYFCADNKTSGTISLVVDNLKATYRNPVVNYSLPDPTVFKSNDGYFYAYSTEDIRNIPIHRSKDLVHWNFVGTAFTDSTRPKFVLNGGLWAPDIHYINGKYVLYYAMSTWGGINQCGIGVFVSDSPKGPFTDKGPLFQSYNIGVLNSIDEFYIEDNGKKYMIWGSFNGIYCIELADDGLSVKADAKKVQISGTATEGSYVHKRGKYYYLFGSTGTCCEGANSTYEVVVGRSENLFGPYVDKNEELMMENHYEVVLHGNNVWAGPGHNAEFMTDDEGNDWMLYHSYIKNDPNAGRVLMLDKVHWVNGWPVITGTVPSNESVAPVFNKNKRR